MTLPYLNIGPGYRFKDVQLSTLDVQTHEIKDRPSEIKAAFTLAKFFGKIFCKFVPRVGNGE
jgi:hypothetical protein